MKKSSLGNTSRLRRGLRAGDPEVRSALKTWGGQAYVDESEWEPEVVLVRPVSAAPLRPVPWGR